MRHVFAASAALTALVLGAAPALAQSTLWSGQGELTDSDPQGEEDRRYDDHPVRLDAGQRYRISVDSEAFDPVARLLRVGNDEPVAENDDGGESLNSRIVYTPQESGDYVLRVLGYSVDARGAYAARVETMPPPPPAITTPGQTVSSSGNWSMWQGTLSDADPQNEGRPYRDYLVRFDGSQVRYISLQATDFDPMVQVFRADQRDEDPVPVQDEDDDGGAGLNSFLVFEPSEPGDYIIRVMSFGSGAGGGYTLYVSQ